MRNVSFRPTERNERLAVASIIEVAAGYAQRRYPRRKAQVRVMQLLQGHKIALVRRITVTSAALERYLDDEDPTNARARELLLAAGADIQLGRAIHHELTYRHNLRVEET
jgi:S-adenosylmethionine synthetase